MHPASHHCTRGGGLNFLGSESTWTLLVLPWEDVYIVDERSFQVARDLRNDFHNGWQNTIATLRRVFSAFGLPEQVVKDNGPKIVSREFADFMEGNGMKHIHTAPYHPSSNEALKRLGQTFKQAMKAGECSGLFLQHQLQSFLMSYCSILHATTGQSAALLFLGHLIRNRFDLLRHESERKVIWKQARHDAHPQFHKFAVGDTVMIRDARDKSQWRTGTVMEQRGLMSYQVQLQSNVIQHRHVDHLHEWVPARVTNAGPPVVMYQHWHLLRWLKPQWCSSWTIVLGAHPCRITTRFTGDSASWYHEEHRVSGGALLLPCVEFFLVCICIVLLPHVFHVGLTLRMLSVVVGPRACCSSNVRCAIVIWYIVTVTSEPAEGPTTPQKTPAFLYICGSITDR